MKKPEKIEEKLDVMTLLEIQDDMPWFNIDEYYRDYYERLEEYNKSLEEYIKSLEEKLEEYNKSTK